jgi:tryptophanyl-tRNA synthetase
MLFLFLLVWKLTPHLELTRKLARKLAAEYYQSHVIYLLPDPHRKLRSIVETCLPNHCITKIEPLTA